jgi:hypothetical protein
MTTLNLAYEDGLVYITHTFGENVFDVIFSVEDKNEFKKFIASFIKNKPCHIRIRDSNSKNTDTIINYKSNNMCIICHNTRINLVRETVLDEFAKIIKLIN